MEKDDIYVKHILDAIRSIEQYTNNLDYKSFTENKMVQDAVIRELEIIGEAVKNLSENFKLKHPETPWQIIADTRNKLIHEYFGVDMEIVWQTIKEDLPKLKNFFS